MELLVSQLLAVTWVELVTNLTIGIVVVSDPDRVAHPMDHRVRTERKETDLIRRSASTVDLAQETKDIREEEAHRTRQEDDLYTSPTKLY